MPVAVPSVPAELLAVSGSPVDARGRVVVTARGEVDPYTAPLLEACLDGQAGRRRVRTVVADLSAVTSFGAAGIAVLARARRRHLARGVRLVVRAGGQPPVLRALELTGLAPLVLAEDEVAGRAPARGPARQAGPRPARRDGRRRG